MLARPQVHRVTAFGGATHYVCGCRVHAAGASHQTMGNLGRTCKPHRCCRCAANPLECTIPPAHPPSPSAAPPVHSARARPTTRPTLTSAHHTILCAPSGPLDPPCCCCCSATSASGEGTARSLGSSSPPLQMRRSGVSSDSALNRWLDTKRGPAACGVGEGHKRRAVNKTQILPLARH